MDEELQEQEKFKFKFRVVAIPELLGGVSQGQGGLFLGVSGGLRNP